MKKEEMVKTNEFKELVKQFMVACDQTVDFDNATQGCLYLDLVEEEFDELNESETQVDELDAICDLIWVAIGLAHSRGYDIEGAFKEVCRSNMSKVDSATGKVIKREDGKILKPSSFSPPHLVPYV